MTKDGMGEFERGLGITERDDYFCALHKEGEKTGNFFGHYSDNAILNTLEFIVEKHRDCFDAFMLATALTLIETALGSANKPVDKTLN